MYCGSCMHDNTLAKRLIADGHDCVLQPVYTPIRVDEDSIARDALFFGGIQVYLIDRFPWLGRLPRWLRAPLDFPPLVRFLTRRAGGTDASELGHLTLSMLAGEDGPLAGEVHRLVNWIGDRDADEVVLSNLLIGGFLPTLAKQCPNVRRVVLLQGDDAFIDHLPTRDRDRVVRALRRLARYIDVPVVHSNFYADRLADLLAVPRKRFEIRPLAIDPNPYGPDAPRGRDGPFRWLYGARLSREKGFDIAAEAFGRLAEFRPKDRWDVFGYLGPENADLYDRVAESLAAAGLAARWTYHGAVDRSRKAELLSRADVMLLPTRYEEPKGLPALEAMASGLPVVVPDHGAWPELIDDTGGGLLYRAGDPDDLMKKANRLREQPKLRRQLGESGRRAVTERRNIWTAPIDW